jgi:hypothetical protein
MNSKWDQFAQTKKKTINENSNQNNTHPHDSPFFKLEGVIILLLVEYYANNGVNYI